MAQLGPDYIASLRAALSDLYEGAADFNKAQGVGPAPGSQAAAEQAMFPRPESLVTAWSVATQLIESGDEHVTAFVKTITEPMEPIACWTCVRSVLESCALAAWLLDPNIDAYTRVGRVFALRYEGLEQQLKFSRVIGRSDEELKAQQDHISDVEQVALSLGYAPVVNSQGRRKRSKGVKSALGSLRLIREKVGSEEGSLYLDQSRRTQSRKPDFSARSTPPTTRSTNLSTNSTA